MALVIGCRWPKAILTPGSEGSKSAGDEDLSEDSLDEDSASDIADLTSLNSKPTDDFSAGLRSLKSLAMSFNWPDFPRY